MNLDENKTKSGIVFKVLNSFLVIVVIGVGAYLLYTNRSRFPENRNTSIQTQNSLPKPTQEVKVIVDIGGAVKNPGVYEMEQNQRIVDLIEKAGGLNEKVDLQYFDKHINKAQKLSDGSKIYIPTIEDKQQSTASSQTNTPTSVLGASTSNRLTNVNTASRSELIDLPEVGEVTAEKIIAARPYNSLQELISKGALKQSQFDKIKDKLTY